MSGKTMIERNGLIGKVSLLGVLTWLCLATPASAQPTISANPASVGIPAGQTQGTTTLTWDAGASHPFAEIWLSVDDGDPVKLFEMNGDTRGTGSREFTVTSGKRHRFILTDFSVELAAVLVGTKDLIEGMQTRTFTPAKVDSRSRQKSGGVCAPFTAAGNPEAGTVGWHQTEKTYPLLSPCVGQAWYTEIAETGVTFDLTILDQVPNLRIKSAILKFDEVPIKWANGDGSPRNVKTCVANVGRPESSLASVPEGSLFPSGRLLTARPAGSRPVQAWDVQDDVRQQLASDKNTPARFGYILKGENVTLTGDDNAACLSQLSNIRLEVEFERLP
jgi:hypothetical protein